MEKSAGGSDFLFLALYAFAGFGLELVLADLIEPMLEISLDHMSDGQSILHWLIMCSVWGWIGWLLLRISKQKYGFDVLAEKAELKMPQVIGMIVCIAAMALVHALDWNGFKIGIEYARLGIVKFIFQYIYYFFETFLFSLLLIFAQKAGEIWFKKKNIPYGGIVLALTWGLGHILSKGSVTAGLLTAFGGFLFGAAYLIAGRDYRRTLPLLYIMFII